MQQNKLRDNNELLSKLGLYTTVAIVVGAVVGSGIFRKPALMASQLGSPELLLAIWVGAGIITLFGALTNAEVAGMITKTGGQYIFFQRMYGDFIAYLYGWAIFAVIQTGSIASITYVFAEYTEYFFVLPRFSPEIEKSVEIYIPFIGSIYPLYDFGVKGLTILVIILLSGVNYLGVVFGGALARFFTTAKILAILVLVMFGFAYGDGSFSNFTEEASYFANTGKGIMIGIIAALSGAFWSYDGWNNITYIAGEVKQPQRNIPRSLFLGTLIVIIVYVLINLSFMYVMPIGEMAQSKLVASDVANYSMGAIGGGFVAAAVMVSTFGTSNGTIMVSARVYYAMSKRGMFFNTIGQVHPKFRTPHNALILQCFWTCVLVISGTFDILTDMLIFISWIFYALGAYGVFVLRKKMPNAERPYKVWGYPWVPAIFVVFATFFVFLTLYEDISTYMSGEKYIIDSVFGIFLCALGIPLYIYFNKKNGTQYRSDTGSRDKIS
jgi:APA family basic amino acid/polyamine antiporter